MRGGCGTPQRRCHLLTTLVFDDVGGHWLAVGLATDTCRGANSEFWIAMFLQPRPDGTLAGEITKTSANNCSVQKAVTFTRTGDVDANRVADPTSQTPRVKSPAEAVHGRYHNTTIWANGGKPAENDWVVRTDCLRTGERCMSFFHAPPDTSRVLVFSGKSWILSVEGDVECRNGNSMVAKDTAEFPLPQPTQDPITLIAGHGHHEQTAPCATKVEFDEKFERTGD